MAGIDQILKDVLYGTVGAAASLIEKGSDVARLCTEKDGELARKWVEKGQEAVRSSQPAADDIKRCLQEFCDDLIKRGEIDITKLTPEQRSELRHQLEEMDCRAEREAAESQVPTMDTPEETPSEETATDDGTPCTCEPGAPDEECECPCTADAPTIEVPEDTAATPAPQIFSSEDAPSEESPSEESLSEDLREKNENWV